VFPFLGIIPLVRFVLLFEMISCLNIYERVMFSFAFLNLYA